VKRKRTKQVITALEIIKGARAVDYLEWVVQRKGAGTGAHKSKRDYNKKNKKYRKEYDDE
jgi:hypothetical protein